MNRVTNLLIGTVLLSSCVCAGCATSTRPQGTMATPNPAATRRPTAVQIAEARPSVTGGELLIPASLSVEGTAVVLAQRDGVIIKLFGQEGNDTLTGGDGMGGVGMRRLSAPGWARS